MSEQPENRSLRHWLLSMSVVLPVLLGGFYLVSYYATVSRVLYILESDLESDPNVSVDEPIAFRTGPSYQWGNIVRSAPPDGFWQKFFSPAWQMDQLIRPAFWGHVSSRQPEGVPADPVDLHSSNDTTAGGEVQTQS